MSPLLPKQESLLRSLVAREAAQKQRDEGQWLRLSDPGRLGQYSGVSYSNGAKNHCFSKRP